MNILIVKLSSLGDIVQTMPVIADIQQRFLDAHIDWVVEEAFAPLVERVVGVRRVIPIALRRWRKTWFSAQTQQARAAFKLVLRQYTYDAVIDCQGLTKSALVARLARLTPMGVCGSFANKSDACSYEWPVKFLLPHNQPMPQRIHAIARTRLLAARLLGYEMQVVPQVVFKELPLPDMTCKKIMLTHGTTRVDNEWPLNAWLSLSQALVAQGYRVLLPQANAQELQFCLALKQLLGAQESAVEILPRVGLSDILNVMATCNGVIGVDSGLSHMAVALGLPHVQIFSQDRAWRAGPVGCARQVAVGGVQRPSADEVIQAWLHVRSLP